MNEPKNRRRFNKADIKAIRLLLFGKGGRGYFEVRVSEDRDLDIYTPDSRMWNTDYSDVYFPVDSTDTSAAAQRSWPHVAEGYELDLYVRQPDESVGMNSPREDWEMHNECVKMIDGEWVVVTHKYTEGGE